MGTNTLAQAWATLIAIWQKMNRTELDDNQDLWDESVLENLVTNRSWMEKQELVISVINSQE